MTGNNLQPFDFKGNQVRILTDKKGEPWFVAKDVCNVLGYQNASKAITDHVDAGDKLNNESLSSLGQRGGWVINESGLYCLILSSKLERAREFRKWVTSEVLPQIRRTGGYIHVDAGDDEKTILARALDAYFSDGIAVNRHRLEAAHHDRMSQIELLKASTGLVHPDFLEAKVRIVIARELGETPELDPMRRPLYTQDYLREKNLGARQCRSKAPTFGKRLKAAYETRHGKPPARAELTLPNGRIIQVNAYTEADRPLFDQVWQRLEQDNGGR